jgi:hypothetical protein
MTSVVLHLKAKNDVNGNPRRLFVLIENGEVRKVVNEGYRGIPEELRDLPIIPINVTTSEFESWKNWKVS